MPAATATPQTEPQWGYGLPSFVTAPYNGQTAQTAVTPAPMPMPESVPTPALAPAAQPLPTEAQGRNITLQSIFREGDTIETISPETAEEINRLGFNTVSSPVVAQKLDHIDQSHGPFTQGDVDALRATIADPTEVLPNLGTKDSPGRANIAPPIKLCRDGSF
jgi:hypothetical protein